jgi:hypothetical protein
MHNFEKFFFNANLAKIKDGGLCGVVFVIRRVFLIARELGKYDEKMMLKLESCKISKLAKGRNHEFPKSNQLTLP